MRKKAVFKNGAWAIISYAVTFFLNLYIRRVFLEVLNNDVLGYETTIGSIFTFLVITESGIGAAITYRLYQALSDNEEKRISKLMRIYEYSYRAIGLLLVLLSAIIYMFLPLFFKEKYNCEIATVVFVISVINVVFQYFFSTKRFLLISDQKAYICLAVDIATSFMGALLKIIVLKFFPDYRLFLCITLLVTLVSNWIIILICKKKYPYLKREKITIRDIKEEKLFKDAKNFFVQKICYSVYGGVDNILTSKFLGIDIVTLVSNYKTIEGNVTTFTEKIFSGLQSGIGNAVYSEKKEKLFSLYSELDFVNYIYSSVVTCCILFGMQPFINLWLGSEYILPDLYVFALSMRIYVAYNQRIATLYRGTIGNFDIDKKFMIYAALLNVIISLSLVGSLGLVGLEIGTIVAASVIWAGRLKAVFTTLFDYELLKRYLIRQAIYLVTLCMNVFVLKILFSYTVLGHGFLIRIITTAVFTLAFNTVLFWKTKEYKMIIKNFMNRRRK